MSTNQLPRPLNDNGAPTSLAGDFQEGGTRLAQEYRYDANGNLTQDRNKGITGIAYNHLNLPRLIHFGIGADSLVFRYTAAGQKVAKLVYQTGQPTLRTDYLGPFQYEQDSLRFFPHAEGRVLRFVSKDAAGHATTRYQREFIFKDHLGNLRLAYRAGQVRTLTAGLEPGRHEREAQQFDSMSVSAPVAQPVGSTLARTGTYAALLNAAPHAVPATPGVQAGPTPLGPLTQLTVQQGDTLRVTAPGLYPQATSNNSFAFSLASFVAALLNPAPGAPAGADGTRRGGLPLLQIGLNAAGLNALVQLPGGVPQAYLRVLSFNQDSVLVDQRTVQLSAAARGNYEALTTGPLVVQQNGYVSVYVGNESAADVYFDDVSIEHRPGLQVQENQYDPTGLELAGLAGTSPGLKSLSQYKWNGKEFQPDLGLNWTQLDWRFVDPQIGGGFHSVDPELENGQESMSPYVFGYDNAVRFNDPNGRCPTCPSPGILEAAWAAGANAFEASAGTVSPALALGIGAAAVVGTAAVLLWDKLPSAERVGDILSQAGAASAAQPGMYSPYMQMYTDDKMRASVKDAYGRVNAEPTGVVYKRTNPETGKGYVGQAKSDERFTKRQKEHDKSKGVRHDYEVLEKAAPGKDLDVAEEKHIRAEGGPKTKSNPNGQLENKRHQMSDERYKKATGGN